MSKEPKLDFADSGRLKMNRHNMGLIFSKTDGHCTYCGTPLDPFSRWHMDHGIPKKQGGPTNYDNLWPACSKCNISKLDRTADEYRRAIPERLLRKVDELEELIGQMGQLAPDVTTHIYNIRRAIQAHEVVFYFEQEHIEQEQEA